MRGFGFVVYIVNIPPLTSEEPGANPGESTHAPLVQWQNAPFTSESSQVRSLQGALIPIPLKAEKKNLGTSQKFS